MSDGPVRPGASGGAAGREPDGDDPGGDDPGAGNQNGEEGGDDDGSKGDDDDGYDNCHYCNCCGNYWWNCNWCHYWTPMYWCYNGYYPGYWYDYWYPRSWGTVYVEYHDYYDYEETYPNIYSPPAQTLAPDSLALEYIDAGAELFRQGSYLDALHKFHMATLVDPNFGMPRFAYALALFAMGIYDYAAIEIRMGLELLPDWIEIGGDIKLMYQDVAEFDRQLSALVNHLKIWPDDEEAILVLGYVSFFSGDLYMADKSFTRLSFSLNYEIRDAASLFQDGITKIKEMIAASDPDSDALEEDSLSLKDVLEN